MLFPKYGLKKYESRYAGKKASNRFNNMIFMRSPLFVYFLKLTTPYYLFINLCNFKLFKIYPA